MSRTRMLALISAMALFTTSCSAKHSQGANTPRQIVKPLPTASPLYKSYPISAAFAKDGPHLTSEQRAWIVKIATSRAYAPMRSRLRFSVWPGVTVPIVVWVDQAAPGEQDHGGHVIGEKCFQYFDPVDRGHFGATGASCSGANFAPVK